MHSQNLIHQQWDTHVPMDHPLSRPHSGEPWPGSPVSPSHPSGHSGGTPTSSRMQAVSRQKTRATQYRKALPQPPAVGVAPAVDYPGYDDVYAAYATPGDYEGGQGAYDMTTPYGTAYEIQNHPPEHEAAAQQQVSGWNFSGSSYRPPTAYDLSIPQVNAATYRTSGGTYPANESYIPSYSTIPRDWSGASYDIVETPTWNSQRTSGVPVIPKRRGSLRSLPSVHLPGWIADGESGASRNTAEDAWRSTAHMATQEIEMADVGIPSLKTDVPRVEITSATPISERASFTLPSPRPGGDTPDAERAKDNHQPALVKQADQMNTDKDNSGPGVRAPSTLVTAEKKKRRKKKDESLILVKKFWDANNMFEKGSEDKENEKKSSARNPTSKGAKGGDAHGAASNDAAKEKPPRAPDANQSSGARAGYGSLNSSVPKIRTEDLRGSWRGYGELRKSYPVLDMRWSSGHSESSSNGAADSAKAPQTLRDSKETESPGGSEKGTLPRSAPAPIFPNHMAQNIVSSTLGFSFDHAKIGELPPIHLDGESMSSIAMEAPNESNFIYSSTMAAKSKRFSGVSMASSFSFDLESNVNGDEDNMRERLRREEFFGPGVGSIRWNKR
ncbi:hypothetical protein BC832DRAFT_15519 [Gaertneriomyces semiglobifer]|nr:hypothetical protein BC832DRAFT_15519 [Gaertneriomyces semiglobifer]